jgi:hypothetical protein
MQIARFGLDRTKGARMKQQMDGDPRPFQHGRGETSDAHGGYRGGSYDNAGYQGDAQASTYGGLGGPGPYGTHGWSRRGDGHDLDDRQFDPDYRQWREQQMRELDRDYAQWRQERYAKFSEEFDRWRAARRAGADTAPGSGTHDESGGTSSPGGSTAARAPKTG